MFDCNSKHALLSLNLFDNLFQTRSNELFVFFFLRDNANATNKLDVYVSTAANITHYRLSDPTKCTH